MFAAEPVVLAAAHSAAKLLAGKVADKFAGTAVDATATRLFDRIREKTADDVDATAALDAVERDPGDTAALSALTDVLASRAQDDSAFREDLIRLVHAALENPAVSQAVTESASSENYAIGKVERDLIRNQVVHNYGIQPFPTSRQVQIYLDVDDPFAVLPGADVELPVTVHNEDDAGHEFRLIVQGQPAAWAETGAPFRVGPDESKVVFVRLRPPRTSGIRPTTYGFRIQVIAKDDRTLASSRPGAIRILPFQHLGLMIDPPSLELGLGGSRKGEAQLAVSNEGNERADVSLSVVTPHQVVTRLGTETLTMEPGESKSVMLDVSLVAPKLIGSRTAVPYYVVANAGDHTSKASGQVIDRGRFARGPVTLFLALCALIVLVLLGIVEATERHDGGTPAKEQRASSSNVDGARGSTVANRPTSTAGTPTAGSGSSATAPYSSGSTTSSTALVSEAPASDPATAASQIIAVETAIAASGAHDIATERAGRLQQRIYRLLATNTTLKEQVLTLLPPEFRDITAANTDATSLLRPARPRNTFPAWRIAYPEPAARLLEYYRGASAEFGVPWQYLAALHLVQSRMGRIQQLTPQQNVPQGPMQFLPSTWESLGIEGDINSNRDAIRGAAALLQRNGGSSNILAALGAYNPRPGFAAAIDKYAQQMIRNERAYFGYYFWEVYYVMSSGDRVFPDGSDPSKCAGAETCPGF